MALEDTCALVLHGAQVGEDREGGVNSNRALLPCEAEWAGPPQPQAIEASHAAAQHLERHDHCTAAGLQRNPHPPIILKRDQGRFLKAEPCPAGAAVDRHGDLAIPGLAHVSRAWKIPS